MKIAIHAEIPSPGFSTCQSSLFIILIIFQFDLIGCGVVGQMIGSPTASKHNISFLSVNDRGQAKLKPGYSIRLRFHNKDSLIGKYPFLMHKLYEKY